MADAAARRHAAGMDLREEDFAVRAAAMRRAIALQSAGDPLLPLLARAEAAAAQVHRQGYAILPDLLPPAAVRRVGDALAPLFEETIARFERLDPQLPRQAVHLHDVLARTRAADEVALDPLLRLVVGTILGADFLFHAGAIVMAHGPGTAAQPLHRDDASFAVLPRPRMPLVLTAAVALDDFTPENGATRLVPGSCWWERSRRPLPEEVVQRDMPAGSVLLWDGAMFHGGGANITPDRMRRTLTFNYVRGWLRTQFNQFLSVPAEIALSLPAELQRALGYAPSAKGLGGCEGEEPLARLQRIAGLSAAPTGW